ncbi:MAG: hypothetical protein JWO96_145 [Candidatus Saccharibacteria bacterium]|nr:hypothetical protein [Candidatus Saccharibacteria bacterium]
MLTALFSRNPTVATRVNEELMWKIVHSLRLRFPEAKSRWEIVHRYGQHYGDECVRDSLDKAIKIGELVEDEDNIYFNVANF